MTGQAADFQHASANGYLTISLAQRSYRVALAQVGSVMELGRPMPVPLADRSLLGLVNHRGRITAVYSAAVLLGVPQTPPTAETLAIITSGRGQECAFAVDGVGGVSGAGDFGTDIPILDLMALLNMPRNSAA